ncbi:RnfABCDGE type electron transport complex subunit B [Gammaproteobacteria bacterium]|nr:RnfABCDGE type electron transport complex subunit B [Gammaproteobacteria bacterium]
MTTIPPEELKRVEFQLDALLPQLQCQRCGYPSCAAYAEAMSTRSATGDRCAPGGQRVLIQLSDLLESESDQIHPEYDHAVIPNGVWIDESTCIGCALCINACPMDAIIGSGKLMHTVVADHCTGCELCLPPCPVDCISPHSPKAPDSASFQQFIGENKLRFKNQFLIHQGRAENPKESSRLSLKSRPRLDEIKASVERVRARRGPLDSSSHR